MKKIVKEFLGYACYAAIFGTTTVLIDRGINYAHRKYLQWKIKHLEEDFKELDDDDDDVDPISIEYISERRQDGASVLLDTAERIMDDDITYDEILVNMTFVRGLFNDFTIIPFVKDDLHEIDELIEGGLSINAAMGMQILAFKIAVAPIGIDFGDERENTGVELDLDRRMIEIWSQVQSLQISPYEASEAIDKLEEVYGKKWHDEIVRFRDNINDKISKMQDVLRKMAVIDPSEDDDEDDD